MYNWTPILNDPHLIQTFGWTVVHSLWQGILIALLYTLWIKRHSQNSERKYIGGLYALLAMVIVSSLTFMMHFGQQDTVGQGYIDDTNIQILPSIITSTVSPTLVPDNYLPLVTNLWILGMIIYSLKISVSWIYIVILKRNATLINDPTLTRVIKKLKETLQIKTPVALAASSIANTPMMVGHIKPLILMPVAIINHLEVAEVEAIIAHEMAHIMRSDFLINIIQSVVDILFYYHPAIYFISEQVRIERENCCDDIAISHLGSSTAYARLLVKLQELKSSPNISLAMNIKRSPSAFVNRIQRLLDIPSKPAVHQGKIALLILIAGTLMGIQQYGNSISNVDNNIDRELVLPGINTPALIALSSQDTTPVVKKIIKKKVITIVNGDSTITETITETDGNDELIINGGKIKWFGEEDDIDLSIMMDSLGSTLGNIKMFLSDGEHPFLFDTVFSMNNEFDFDSLMNGMNIKQFNLDSILKDGQHRMLFFGDGDGDFDIDIDIDGSMEKLLELENWFTDENIERSYPDREHPFFKKHLKSTSPADRLSNAMNKDQLLAPNTNNKVELSGKHLKINGEKQPKNLHGKYKHIWEQATGATLHKKDKVTFEFMGKDLKRQSHSY